MQTNFSEAQLANPRISSADKILRKCVHCGFCTATCPTYVLLGDERDSPRGRIYLIKDMFENGRPASPEVTTHIDRCLSCLSCMTTCPSGVDYMHLVDLARLHIEETGQRSFQQKVIRRILASILPYPRRFRMALLAAVLAKPMKRMIAALGLKEMAAMLDMARFPRAPMPRVSPPRRAASDFVRPLEGPQHRVILLPGCAQQALRPEINTATVQFLERIGIEVVVPANVGCCGALTQHMGKEAESLATVRHNIDEWWPVIEQGTLDAIVINASGCGTTVKDYGHMLARDPNYARKASHIAGLAKDITEFLADFDLGAPRRWSSLRVAYHSACSMQHGQRVNDQPRALLRKAGFAVAEVPEGHICCGSAGTYNILQPELARQLRDRKISNIETVKPDIIATGNIGCIVQLQSGTDIPVVHTVELLQWAYGGWIPRGLEGLKGRVSEVPDMGPVAQIT